MGYQLRILLLLVAILHSEFDSALSAAVESKFDALAGKRIVQLAKLHFKKDILPGEKAVFDAAQDGEVAYCESEPYREIRADRLAWLCTDKQASALVSRKGVQISGATIKRDLDLNWAIIAFPLAMRHCQFSDKISLEAAKLLNLDFTGSTVPGLMADFLRVETNVFLRLGFVAYGEVRLSGAKIDGNLFCDGGQFLNEEGPAITCNSAEIHGSIFLTEGFRAEGAVDIADATIGRDLNCADGHFFGRKTTALSCRSARICGHLILYDSRVGGSVDMDAATIDGQVDCREGHFATKSGPALQCNSARIGGNFICDGALFFSSTKYAINADDVRIGSDLDLRYGFCTNAIVWLQNATINGTLDCIAGSISSSDDF